VTELSVFFVGRMEHELASCPELMSPGSAIRRFEDPRSAAAYLVKSESAPDLIVLAESRPGQFSSLAIHELRRLAPLARIWRLLGSWCEGEKRTGKPPAGCTSTLWHQWQPRATRAMACMLDGDCPPWGLPVTATPDEQTLALSEQPLPRGSGAIVICAYHAETASALADACRLAGYDSTVVSDVQTWNADGAMAVLWDMPANQVEERSFRKLRVNAGGVPIFALMSFPRAADIERAVAAGIAGVISKPFLLRDLFWHFEQVRGVVD
jgi:CheY-like chemotaxis protein